MSPLTKLFIVLHVVLSLMLSAGLVVFVNRVEHFRDDAKAKESEVASSKMALRDAQADAASARQSAENAALVANSKISDLQKQVTDSQKASADKDAQIAAANTNLALAQSTNAKSDEALKASEDQKANMMKIVGDLRKDVDDFAKKNNDLNLAVSTLTQTLESTERHRRDSQEQLVQSKARVDNLQKLLVDKGINPDLPGGLAAGAVPINGIVRTVQVINQIPYATISVGSSDNVQPGMQFTIIDREKNLFLGKLIVNSVEPTSATGKLEGPHIGDVHVGAEVRTQL